MAEQDTPRIMAEQDTPRIMAVAGSYAATVGDDPTVNHLLEMGWSLHSFHTTPGFERWLAVLLPPSLSAIVEAPQVTPKRRR